MSYEIKTGQDVISSNGDKFKNVLSSCILLDCDIGTYGNECNNTCGHCINEDDCFYTNGTCLNGCDSGYLGALCKTCKYLTVNTFLF